MDHSNHNSALGAVLLNDFLSDFVVCPSFANRFAEEWTAMCNGELCENFSGEF